MADHDDDKADDDNDDDSLNDRSRCHHQLFLFCFIFFYPKMLFDNDSCILLNDHL